jgi:hypothetical protein
VIARKGMQVRLSWVPREQNLAGMLL